RSCLTNRTAGYERVASHSKNGDRRGTTVLLSSQYVAPRPPGAEHPLSTGSQGVKLGPSPLGNYDSQPARHLRTPALKPGISPAPHAGSSHAPALQPNRTRTSRRAPHLPGEYVCRQPYPCPRYPWNPPLDVPGRAGMPTVPNRMDELRSPGKCRATGDV